LNEFKHATIISPGYKQTNQLRNCGHANSKIKNEERALIEKIRFAVYQVDSRDEWHNSCKVSFIL
jgi:hypothetical protein